LHTCAFLEGKLVTIGFPSMTRTNVDPTTTSDLNTFLVS
jgi:hypothetical protein